MSSSLTTFTCESEVAMLVRSKLARAATSRLLRKCCFSRRSERRAPSILRALERNVRTRRSKSTKKSLTITWTTVRGTPAQDNASSTCFPRRVWTSWRDRRSRISAPSLPSALVVDENRVKRKGKKKKDKDNGKRFSKFSTTTNLHRRSSRFFAASVKIKRASLTDRQLSVQQWILA